MVQADEGLEEDIKVRDARVGVQLASGWLAMYSTALSTVATVSTTVDLEKDKGKEHVLLWMVSASLSGISMLNSSSMAMTTSTVSRLSRPRSLAKCAVDVICGRIGQFYRYPSVG